MVREIRENELNKLFGVVFVFTRDLCSGNDRAFKKHMEYHYER